MRAHGPLLPTPLLFEPGLGCGLSLVRQQNAFARGQSQERTHNHNPQVGGRQQQPRPARDAPLVASPVHHGLMHAVGAFLRHVKLDVRLDRQRRILLLPLDLEADVGRIDEPQRPQRRRADPGNAPEPQRREGALKLAAAPGARSGGGIR